MLIESLIRLGKPLIEGDLPPREVLLQISDVAEEGARDFFARVFVVEIKRGGEAQLGGGGFQAKVLPVQTWGSFEDLLGKGKRQRFVVEVDKAVGAPFALTKGGNPRQPQGRYGVPAYPVYEGDVKAFIGERGAAELSAFLSGRIDRTVGFSLREDELARVISELQPAMRSALAGATGRTVALILLADVSSGLYSWGEPGVKGNHRMADVGASALEPGKRVVARLDRVLEAYWEAKIAEGAEGGERTGSSAVCFFCGARGRVVSAYCKAWPWFLKTWTCPRPLDWQDEDMVRGIALCPDCYKGLYYGANVFLKLASSFDHWLTREIFSPVASAPGKEKAKRGSVEAILGTALVLPVLDGFLTDPEQKAEFAASTLTMLSDHRDDRRLDTHLKFITGLDRWLPEEMDREDFRLQLVYFTGKVERGDIYLRAIIEDVLPSTVTQLTKLARHLGEQAVAIDERLRGKQTDERVAAVTRARYSSLPYLLTAAYGAPYLWTTLASVLHHEDISWERFVRNSAIRMTELGHCLAEDEVYWRLNEEVLFYLTFREFLRACRKQFATEGEGGRTMRSWQELEEALSAVSPREMNLNSAEEVGFACGFLTGLFSRQYWQATKAGREGKDYLAHRVMTFGTDLTPEAIYRRALVRLEEVARRRGIHLSEDYRQRLAVVLWEFGQRKEEIRRNRYDFMAGFWSGHNLARARKAVGQAESPAELVQEGAMVS
ncbi:MAG: hypothetical protein QME79_06645 [Bacillota bacterium]|nr:hypothetical protein [Bacillota bacterium]